MLTTGVVVLVLVALALFAVFAGTQSRNSKAALKACMEAVDSEPLTQVSIDENFAKLYCLTGTVSQFDNGSCTAMHSEDHIANIERIVVALKGDNNRKKCHIKFAYAGSNIIRLSVCDGSTELLTEEKRLTIARIIIKVNDCLIRAGIR